MLPALLLPLLAALQEPVPLEELDGSKLVALSLVADRGAVRPGETFRLGVRLVIERGWHVYWENPGDSGTPTQAQITAPAGFEVGPLRFPAPVRHEVEGDIVTYVHEGELLLVADVRAPAGLEPGAKPRFRVAGRWLVCTDVCLQGSGEAELELPAAPAGSGPAPAANAAAVAAARARAPRPWAEIAPRAGVARSGTDEEPVYRVRVRGARELEFFPARSDATLLVSRDRASGDAGASIELAFRHRKEQAGGAGPRLAGVLEVAGAEGSAFYALDAATAEVRSGPGR